MRQIGLRRYFAISATVFVLGLRSATTMAQGIATVIGLEGGAQVGAADHLSTAVAGSELTVGQEMRTDESGRLQVVFADGSSCTLGPGTRLRIDEYSFDPAGGSARAKLTLLEGKVRALVSPAFVAQGGAFELETAGAVARVTGTVFVMTYDRVGEVSEVVGVSGRVAVYSTRDRTTRAAMITAGDLTRVTRGKFPTAPQPLAANLFRQYLEDVTFFGVAPSTSLATGNVVLAGKEVPVDVTSSALAAPLSTSTGPVPGIAMQPESRSVGNLLDGNAPSAVEAVAGTGSGGLIIRF